MDDAQILHRLAYQQRLPVEAFRAAGEDPKAVAPIFLRAIESYMSQDSDPAAEDALFFIFHLLGAWREKSAYRPLSRMLRRPIDELDPIFGDFLTETGHRVMAAVFDGDPAPLYDVILDPDADEFIRSGMCETIAMVTRRGDLAREEAARFLRACYSELSPQEKCFVWHGWQSAIAFLGLRELQPLVEEAFARGFISPSWLSFEDFEEDLQRATADSPALRASGNFSEFGDIVAELSHFHCFNPKQPKVAEHPGNYGAPWQPGLAYNPFKGIGRNEPCPCGSGKKFKKCCLPAITGVTARHAA